MSDQSHPKSQKILRIGFAAFVLISALLIAAYYALFAKDYALLYENMRESDTSAVTAELDKQGIAYRLEDDGHAILVDKGDVASARVAVAAAGLLAGGEVGFELFNDSDIGLSEFSQKMNYLRALQGELTRTIMAMDGIRFTRVHLALPERGIFRSEQALPSAAITVQTIDGRPLAPAKVQGLQRLVAAAVTGLSAEEVVILDDDGMALSAPRSASADPAFMTERAAFEQYAGISARTAIADLMGSQVFEVVASARSLPPPPAAAGSGDGAAVPISDSQRDRLTLIVRTASDLDPGRQERIRSRIAGRLALDFGSGDEVDFKTGILPVVRRTSTPVPDAPTWREEERTAHSQGAEASSIPDMFANRWLWFAAGFALVLFGLIWRQRGALSDQERDHFAAVLAAEIENHRSEGRV